MANTIFVDASALIALANKGDQYHSEAKEYLSEITAGSFRLMTSNFVLDETYTRIKRAGGSKMAIDFGNEIQSNSGIKSITIDHKLEKRAWEIFKKYSDQPFSYTDCTSFALMRERKIQNAFAFDNDFRIFGFNLLPTS